MLGSFVVGSRLFLDRKGKTKCSFYPETSILIALKNKLIVNAEFILFTKETMLFMVWFFCFIFVIIAWVYYLKYLIIVLICAFISVAVLIYELQTIL